MFTGFTKSGLARFGLFQPRRMAPGPHEAALSNRAYVNDNLPGFRRPAAAGKRRPPTPALACQWFNRDGALQCCWHSEGDRPSTCDFDEQEPSGLGSAFAWSPIRARRVPLAG